MCQCCDRDEQARVPRMAGAAEMRKSIGIEYAQETVSITEHANIVDSQVSEVLRRLRMIEDRVCAPREKVGVAPYSGQTASPAPPLHVVEALQSSARGLEKVHEVIDRILLHI